MRFFGYVILLFSISAFLYLMGYGPIYKYFGQDPGDTSHSDRGTPYKVACPASNIFCTDTTILIGVMIAAVLGAGALVALGGGFAAFYIVPLILLIALLNFVIFPFDFVFMLPAPLSVILVVLLNILTVFALLSFTRGGA